MKLLLTLTDKNGVTDEIVLDSEERVILWWSVDSVIRDYDLKMKYCKCVADGGKFSLKRI